MKPEAVQILKKLISEEIAKQISALRTEILIEIGKMEGRILSEGGGSRSKMIESVSGIASKKAKVSGKLPTFIDDDDDIFSLTRPEPKVELFGNTTILEGTDNKPVNLNDPVVQKTLQNMTTNLREKYQQLRIKDGLNPLG
jgi:hypothetical protein